MDTFTYGAVQLETKRILQAKGGHEEPIPEAETHAPAVLAMQDKKKPKPTKTKPARHGSPEPVTLPLLTPPPFRVESAADTPHPEDELEDLDVPGFPRPIKVGKHTPLVYRVRLSLLVQQYKSVFETSPESMITPANVPPYDIQLKPDTDPIALPVRRKPQAELQVAKTLVEDQLACGFLHNSVSPWRAEVLVVPKHIEPGVDPTTLNPTERLRAVVDYRELNKRILPDGYPMPTVDEVVEKAADSAMFSRLDVKQAFHQVPITARSQPVTAFSVGDYHVEYSRLPMGVNIAPAAWCRTIGGVMRGQRGAVTYLDDILLSTPPPDTTLDPPTASLDRPAAHPVYEDQLAILEQTFQRLENSHLRCTLHKCVFFTHTARFTGYILHRGTVTTDPSKTDAIDHLTPGRSLQHLQRFMGFVSYYGRHHIWHLSAKTAPLRKLLLADTPWEWTPDHQACADRLVDEIKQRIVRRAPDWGAQFYLTTDYSAAGLAAILYQKSADGREHPIAFASRATTQLEATMGAYEGELTAVLFGVRTFHYYLYGRTFTLVTDHEALRYLQQHNGRNTRLGRTAALLSTEYTFVVLHKAGRLSAHVDALSRGPMPAPGDTAALPVGAHCDPPVGILPTPADQRGGGRDGRDHPCPGAHPENRDQRGAGPQALDPGPQDPGLRTSGLHVPRRGGAGGRGRGGGCWW
jgi:hypothetical protein